MGKYSAVLRRHGKRGFGVPSKAPDVGSFPLYPMNRARYALTIIASPNYDSKMKLRASIAKRALAAHPSLKSYWNQLNRETIKPRLSKSTSMRRKAANPRRSEFKYRVSASVFVGGKPKDFSFVMRSPWTQSGQMKAAEKALAEKLKVRSVKLMFEQEDDEFEGRPLFSLWSPSNQNITGAVTITDAISPLEPRRKNMARHKSMPRRKNYGAIKLLTNPLGMPLGKGQAVVVDHRGETTPKGGWKGRVHIRKGMKDLALCGAGQGKHASGPSKGKKRGVIATKAKNVTCYRCIKIRVMDRGDDIERKLVARPSKRRTHMMIPGGREGVYVSGVKPADMVGGEPFFLGGTEDHPSQTRMLTKRQKAKRRADMARGRSRKVQAGRSVAQRGEMVANPRSYGQGYSKGASDYGSMHPMAANALRNRSLSYQEGYLEGYSDTASKPNPKRRKNTKRRRNTRAKTYVYDSWGETIFFAEDLGFKYTANDEKDPDGLEDDAIRFIESKGYKVVGYNSNPRKRRNTRKRSNPKTKRFRKADGTFGYMVGGKFATKRKYDAAKKRR